MIIIVFIVNFVMARLRSIVKEGWCNMMLLKSKKIIALLTFVCIAVNTVVVSYASCKCDKISGKNQTSSQVMAYNIEVNQEHETFVAAAGIKIEE